jgi:hypothetical protein
MILHRQRSRRRVTGVAGPGDPDPPHIGQDGLVNHRDEPIGEKAGMEKDQRFAAAAGV